MIVYIPELDRHVDTDYWDPSELEEEEEEDVLLPIKTKKE